MQVLDTMAFKQPIIWLWQALVCLGPPAAAGEVCITHLKWRVIVLGSASGADQAASST